MNAKQIIDLILTIIGVLLVVVPYIATMLVHTRNKVLVSIGEEALKITSALEETDMSGAAKKEAAASKLNTLFGGGFINKLIGLKLTPEQLADQVDAAVATIRTLGIKQSIREVKAEAQSVQGVNAVETPITDPTQVEVTPAHVAQVEQTVVEPTQPTTPAQQ